MTSSSNVFKQVGDAVTGILKGFSGEKAAEERNAMSIDLANTAHQREVADLKAAGLNPALSAGGSGAETPVLDTPGNKAAAALELMKGMTEIKSQFQNMNLQSSQIKNNDINNTLIKNQIREIDNNIINNKNITDAEVNLKNAQADFTKTQNEIESWKAAIGKEGANVVNNTINGIKNFFNGKKDGKTEDATSKTIENKKDDDLIKENFPNLKTEEKEELKKLLGKDSIGKKMFWWMIKNRNRSGS